MRGNWWVNVCRGRLEAIPPGYGTPMLGPIATALGEVFQFQVKATKESGLSPMDLRTLLDWFIAYQLRGVEGVTEINAHGGEMKTYQVEVDPDKLANYRLSMTDLFNALRSNNANVGGGYLVREGEARYIRGVSQVRTIDDIAAIVIDERDGVPVTVRDVAKVLPSSDDPRRPGDARRPGRDRHGAGDDADRPERPRSRQPGQGRDRPTEKEPATGRDDRAAL